MELNIVTECWVEPQSGYVDGVQESWQYLHGLSYQKIPKAVCFCVGERQHLQGCLTGSQSAGFAESLLLKGIKTETVSCIWAAGKTIAKATYAAK